MTTKNSNSKKRIPKLSNTKKPSTLSFEEWQTTLRKQFSTEQKFSIKNIGDHKVYSDFDVRNPSTKKVYKVAIRSQTTGLNFCSCPDFKVNNLGTCKHIEYVFNFIKSRKTLAKMLNEEHQRPYSSVTLKYGHERKIVLRIGSVKPKEMRKLASAFFDSDLTLKESSFEKFEKFLEKALQLDSQFRCYTDALEYILTEREKQSRKKRVSERFPNGVQSKELNKIIKATLYPYQKEAVLKAVEAGRYIIADDMGLGKTIQSLAISELLKNMNGIESVLIVCPTSLKYQWETELKKFTESTSRVIEGLADQRRQQYASGEFYKIISYNVATRDTDLINKMKPDLIILDEAQRIKNWKTKTAQSIKQLDSPYCLVLTGTPLENKLDELHSLVEFVDRYKMGLLARFLFDHQITDEGGKVTGYKNLNKIGESIASICIRRTKSEVLKQLPPRITKTLMVNVTQEQLDCHSEYYERVCKLVNKWKRFGFLSEKERQMLMIGLNQMRMVSDSTYIIDQQTRHDTKIAELRSVLEEVFQNKEDKVVIFSQWERMTRLVSQELEDMGIKYEYLHGGIAAIKRKDLLTNFKNDPQCRVFLSTDAGGVGLNLQSASVLINMDCPWNPAVLEQRIGRIHRMGQLKPVTIINLISKGTIEERMLELLSFKKKMFEGVLDGGEDSVFMGESKMKQFMKTVEELTVEKPLEHFDRKVESANQTVDDMFLESTTGEEFQPLTLYEREDLSANAENNKNKTVIDNGLIDLVYSGMSFFEKLSETLSNPEKTTLLVNSMMETDRKTGKSYLKIPVENAAFVNKAAGVLTGILQLFKK